VRTLRGKPLEDGSKRVGRELRLIVFGGALLCAAAVVAVVWIRMAHVTLAPLTTSPGGRHLRWVAPDIVLRPLRRSESSDDRMLQSALTAGAGRWNQALEDCEAPKLRVAPAAQNASQQLRRDGISSFVLKRQRWCPDFLRDVGDCYERHRAAITHLYPDEPVGERYADVYEADIEFNGVDFRWSMDESQLGARYLLAAVMHELGHVLGLEHSCGPDLDANAVKCVPGEHRQLVMYPFPVEPGREPVLEPSRSERKAICALYGSNSAEAGRPQERAR
jgi:hypothetical protein